MSVKKIMSLVDEVEPKSILVLCHQNADPDALCSAFAFSQLLKRLKPEMKVEVASPEGVSRLSKALSNYLPIEVMSEKPDFESADVIVMLDTNTVRQLGEWGEIVKESSAPLVVIDHHASHPETEKMATLCISDEDSSSTSEIVYGFFKELGLKPSKEEAEALFLGIAFDTKHFILANSNTFKTTADLVDAGVNVREALPRLSLTKDPSERIARLKACRRVKLVRIDNWLIAFSHVRSFQASAARALIEMGAHLAMVGGHRNDELQISVRADQEFYRQTGFHLGRDLAKPLGEYIHGMGGGHSTAAGMNGIGDFESAVKRATKILKQKLAKV
ncbi:MAG: DHH family phosphoesterase [Candidatus Bathyarchaeota archaeon]|nr:DHH family phosphoesterase [Candidatus Bathyarchaeota archaeon]